ncbi:hypothetical protein GO755_30480 [Spirosoma sp. HMF4905]|uniref:Phage gp6-like head-tail connector protein n=1 Tax=Spirosoma arboris TaxID=2682092 RepID=A0A7K1SKW6_9BACT|nr:hypothetical protein [Spirosoma arboris]MVM34398.1 hypothetical protein [Spirosoma arboris]
MKSGLIIRVQSREVANFDLINKIKALLFLDLNLNDYNDLLLDCRDRAIDDVERFTGLSIGPQVRKVSYSILTETTDLPYGPYLSTVSVSAGGSVDADGRLTADWPTGGNIVFKCGYDFDSIPAVLLDAVARAAAEYSGLNSSLKAGGWKDSIRRYRTFNWAS